MNIPSLVVRAARYAFCLYSACFFLLQHSAAVATKSQKPKASLSGTVNPVAVPPAFVAVFTTCCRRNIPMESCLR